MAHIATLPPRANVVKIPSGKERTWSWCCMDSTMCAKSVWFKQWVHPTSLRVRFPDQTPPFAMNFQFFHDNFQIFQCLTQLSNFGWSPLQVQSTPESYATQTNGQGPAGALTICFEERIMANRRGIFKLAAFNSSHYQFENEPFAKKKLARAPAKPG